MYKYKENHFVLCDPKDDLFLLDQDIIHFGVGEILTRHCVDFSNLPINARKFPDTAKADAYLEFLILVRDNCIGHELSGTEDDLARLDRLIVKEMVINYAVKLVKVDYKSNK